MRKLLKFESISIIIIGMLFHSSSNLKDVKQVDSFNFPTWKKVLASIFHSLSTLSCFPCSNYTNSPSQDNCICQSDKHCASKVNQQTLLINIKHFLEMNNMLNCLEICPNKFWRLKQSLIDWVLAELEKDMLFTVR